MSKLQPTPQDEIERLRTAGKALHDNPIWQEALDRMEAEYTELWAGSQLAQGATRENAFFMVQAIRKLRSQLRSFANTGKLERSITEQNVKQK